MAMSVMTNATPSVSDPVYPTAESTRDAGSGVLGDCRSRARHANERSSPKRKRTATIGERPDLLPPGPLAILGAGGYLMRRFRPAQTEPRLAVINAASVDGRRHTAGGAWRQCNDTIAVVPSGCKSKFSTPRRSAKSMRPSPPLRASGPTPYSSGQTRFFSVAVCNLSPWRSVKGFQRFILCVSMSWPAG